MGIGKIQRYAQPYSNVVATGTATNNLTPGRTLENLTLKLGGTFTKAMITNLRMKANGKIIKEGSGSQLDALNAYRGVATDANYLEVPFSDKALISEFDRAVGNFDTSIGVANITTEVTIAGATSPTLVGILTETAQQKDAQGNAAPFAPVLEKILMYPFNIATGGKLPFVTPFGPKNGAIIKRVHVFHGGNMSGAEVKLDGLTVHESLKLENEFQQKRYGRVPQTNVYTIDFVVDGNVRKALDTRDARALEWYLTFSAADSGTILVEYLDVLGNL